MSKLLQTFLLISLLFNVALTAKEGESKEKKPVKIDCDAQYNICSDQCDTLKKWKEKCYDKCDKESDECADRQDEEN